MKAYLITALAVIIIPVILAIDGSGQEFPDADPDSIFVPGPEGLPDSTRADDDVPEFVEAYDFGREVLSVFGDRRLDLAGDVRAAHAYDAAGLIRFNPSNFIIPYQATPMRTVVAPFGLPGGRIDPIFNGYRLHPREHLPEPDGRIGFDDLPLAPLGEVYNFEGPLGLALGGENATASLVLVPPEPETTRAESRLIVDKGSFGMANTGGVLTERKSNGRRVRAAVEYRKADGLFLYRDDDGYHQWGDLVYPLGGGHRLFFNGRLYRRTGHFIIRPDRPGQAYNRSRRDRDLSAGYRLVGAGGDNLAVEFRHQRSESSIRTGVTGTDSDFASGLDVFNNSLSVNRQGRLGGVGYSVGTELAEEEYKDNAWQRKRHRGILRGRIMAGDSTGGWLAGASIEKVGGYDPAPSGVLALVSKTEAFYLSLSGGYSTRFPSQYELDLTEKEAFVSGSTGYDYYESGNNSLKAEKQMIGNFTLGLGRPGSDTRLAVTGGKIFDGIDWRHDTVDTPGGTVDRYRPVNHDIEFVNAALTKRLSMFDRVGWLAGGSYRYVQVGGDEEPEYSPDYQLFSGLELYQYVEFIDLHLYGYLEAGYIGPYTAEGAGGDPRSELGDEMVVDFRLSFRIKKFRFYYLFRNLDNENYQIRDGYTILGRSHCYGITWEFLD